MTIDTARARWLALYVLCLGDLLIVLDVSIVNVALPSIREDLGFSEASLAWVVNAYTLTFGGFMLLAGRLGDLLGHRRMFVSGVGLFTVASGVCGLATSQEMLVVARAIQGLGGAVVAAVALSLIMTLFTEAADRAKAMGVIGFVAAGGGSIGVLAGGVITDTLSWHWIFLVNVPIGIGVIVACLALLPVDGMARRGRLDIPGAVLVTGSLMVAVYAIVNGNENGWTSAQTLGLLGAAAVAFLVFLLVESRVSEPLVPLGLFRLRSVAASNIVGILWSAAMFAMFFLSALYLQLALGYTPLEVGLAFLPANLLMGALSLGLSARLVMRFGIKKTLTTGLTLVAVGLALFARAPVDAAFVVDVLPSMIVLGIGIGLAMNPLLLAATANSVPTTKAAW
jgi:EmrB/QacA subfamily drug resistance transporter